MAEKSTSQNDLLSPEESTILKHLESRSTRDQRFHQLPPLNRLWTDQEYADEIVRLDASRKRYISQKNALAAQNDLLRTIRQRQLTGRNVTERTISQKALSEAQYTRSLNDQTLADVSSRLEAKTSTIEALSKTAPMLVTERLRIHDQTISSIPSSQFTTPALPNSYKPDPSRIELLTTALINLQGSSLRDRLDRVFLETVSKRTTDPNPDPASTPSPPTPNLRNLETDIRSLYIEIDDVFSMLVSHQYRQPLTAALEQLKLTEQRHSNHQLATTIQTLEGLTTELAELEEYVEATRSGRFLLKHFEKHLGQIERNVNSALSPATLPVDATGTSKAAAATKRFVEHICGPEKRDAGMAGHVAAKQGNPDEISKMLDSAARTRAAAVEALTSSAAQTASIDISEKISELEARIGEARSMLEEHGG